MPLNTLEAECCASRMRAWAWSIFMDQTYILFSKGIPSRGIDYEISTPNKWTRNPINVRGTITREMIPINTRRKIHIPTAKERTITIKNRTRKLTKRPVKDVSPYIGTNKFFAQMSSPKNATLPFAERNNFVKISLSPFEYHQKGNNNTSRSASMMVIFKISEADGLVMVLF